MRRFLAITISAMLAVLMFASGVAAYGGPETSTAACGGGELVINVTQKVLNDFDSGTGGNNWAFDDFNRQIQVLQTAPNTFCATVDYQGQFVTIAGTSPGSTGTVPDGLQGTFNGGYRSTVFTGTLLATPLWATRGSVGTTDYQCNVDPGCPGYVDWTTQYFSSTTGYDLAWWGWQYRAGSHGTWINSIDGNSGDITG